MSYTNYNTNHRKSNGGNHSSHRGGHGAHGGQRRSHGGGHSSYGGQHRSHSGGQSYIWVVRWYNYGQYGLKERGFRNKADAMIFEARIKSNWKNTVLSMEKRSS